LCTVCRLQKQLIPPEAAVQWQADYAVLLPIGGHTVPFLSLRGAANPVR
jgi:hypothetical protein